MNTPRPRALVLLSGGLDSATCLAIAFVGRIHMYTGKPPG